jgi:hypothetical protein
MKKKRKQNMNITKKKIMNLLNMKNTIKINGKKTKMKALVSVKRKVNIKQSIGMNSKLNMRMNMNAKMKLNMMLQMRMICCRFAG